jgi:TPR repeat protein
MYDDGSGAPISYEAAANWHRKAANQGYWTAQSSLGLAYSLGYGVPEDLVMAYMWLSLSLASRQTIRNLNDVERDVYLKRLSRLEERMTPALVREAQRRSAEWRPTVSPTPIVRKKR